MSGIQQLLLAGGGAVVPVDPYFYSVTSLLHGDGANGGQNNTFLDSSTNNFTITRNGNTTQGSFSPFSQTGWSNYFDGSGDYLETPSNAAFTLGSSGDFTVECWVYATATPGNYAAFMTTWSDANTGYPNRWFIGVHDSKIKWYNDAGASAIAASSNIQLNTWLHVAAVRSGSTITLYINGTAIGTQTTSQSYTTQGTVKLGYSGTGGNYFYGYISNARVVKGTAVYTANFTVPTAPLTAITNTSLLTCQANRFFDASSNNFTITRNGDVSVQPFSPFNPITAYSTSAVGGSGYFDGSGDWLNTSSTQVIPSGSFTVEAWVYLTTTVTGAGVVAQGTLGDAARFSLAIEAGLWWVQIGAATINAGTPIINTWTHLAATFNGSTLTLYVNGTSVGTVSTSTNAQNTTLRIGSLGPSDWIAYYWPGYIGQIRISNTVRSISVPTALYTADANTVFLSNFTNGAIFDNAAVADYETVGNAQISTSVKKYGTGSISLDGNGDYLFTPSNQTLAFGTADFTIEFWVYFNAVNTLQVILDFRPNATASSASPDLYLNSDGTLRWFVSGADRITSGALSASTWYHVAICRVASQTKLFVNGTQSGSTYADTTSYLQSGAAFGFNRNNGGSLFYYLNGYIDDLRISNGIGRYPYNFTPPTAEFPNIGGTVTLTADPYFDYTTLLLPGNGTNGAQNNTFLDSSTNAFSITRNGNTTQGTFSPFSQTGWSVYQPAAQSDYVNFTTSAGSLFQFTGDFTVEAWLFCPTIGSDCSVWVTELSGSGFFALNIDSTNYNIYLNAGSPTSSFGHGITLNQWVHVAMVRSGSTVTIYTNGVSRGTITNSSTLGYQNPTLARYGGGAAGTNPRYISNLRIVKGTAVYTANFTPPSTPLTAISGTSLLTASSNRFNDVAAAGSSPTITGSPSIEAFSPFNPTAAWSAATYGGSGYFDGSGDYLTVASNAALQLPTQTFTLETFVYFTSLPAASNAQAFFQKGRTGDSNFEYAIYLYNDAGTYKIQFYGSNDGVNLTTNVFSSGISVSASSWNHIAVTRNSTTLSFWFNGASAGTATCDATFYSGTGTLGIGGNSVGANPLVGYLNGSRIVKGTAVYTGAYTVPTAPLTAIANTSLLTNFTNAGIYDATSKNDLETVGNAQISTAQSKFGGSSMLFDGTGDYLYRSATPILPFGTGDFTLECWIYTASPSDSPIMESRSVSDATDGFTLTAFSTTVIRIYTSSALISATVSNYSSAWTHVAVVKYNGTTTLYVNGVSGGTTTSLGNMTNQDIVVGGGRYAPGASPTINKSFDGYIDDFRITRGIARYTSNFTPPTTAFLTL